ncbi:hypothetical protein NE237_018850 [Protea cynaroides]|uniref:Uncharacterized protein n=1 Tax=Protea cynaroides TaxID=273540 RepID=A0A9Q0KAN0_9MAGN|nr:hypothetical protein NE237_018850 [Protea cynaroides]
MKFLNPTNDKTKNQPRNQKSIHHSTGSKTISRGGSFIEEEEIQLSRATSVSSGFSSPRRERETGGQRKKKATEDSSSCMLGFFPPLFSLLPNVYFICFNKHTDSGSYHI